MRWQLLLLMMLVLMSGGMARSQTTSDSSPNMSWTSTNQQSDTAGAVNPTRTRTTHSETNGRTVDRTSVERMGPDGRYVPYSDVERESVKVNETTTRNIERTFGRGPDGQRTLIQERQEELRELPGGEQKAVRTTSNPDGDGRLQVVQRETTDSRQVSPGVRETKTTISSADGSGGLSPTVQVEEHTRQTDKATTEFRKSTSLSDGAGHWTLSEIREGTTKRDASGTGTKEERVLRPGSDGKLALVERTVSKEAKAAGGESRETTETYSTDVPGMAGDNGLQLVRRESTVQGRSSSGVQTTKRTVERTNPGDPGAGLHLSQEAIDIVRPGASGVARRESTIRASDANGSTNTVWVDLGKTDNPPAVTVDTGSKKSEVKSQK